jgi:hypothetical protein
MVIVEEEEEEKKSSYRYPKYSTGGLVLYWLSRVLG